MGFWPDPTPFEDADGSLSASLDALIRGPGAALPGVLVLGAGGGTRAVGTRRAAIRLARAWVRSGRRVVLADLEFDSASLHRELGVGNDEGMADYFAFGSSLARLERRLDGGAWSFVPAGLWVPEPATLMSSPRWSRLLQGLADSDTTLLAYVPADAPGVTALARNLGAVIVLCPLDELPELRPFSVLAVLSAARPPLPGTPAGRDRAAHRETADEEFERIRLPKDTRAREALMAELRSRQRAALMAPRAVARHHAAEAGAEERTLAPDPGVAGGAGRGMQEPAAESFDQSAGPVTDAAEQSSQASLVEEPPVPIRVAGTSRRRRPSGWWWAAGMLVVIGALVAAWLLLPGRARSPAPARQEATGSRDASASPAAVSEPAADTVLAFAVALDEHLRLSAALDRQQAVRSALPEPGAFVVPHARGEALFYRVLAGPVEDSAAAAGLRDSLARRLQLTGTVERAAYAFLLGEYATREAADSRIAELRGLGVPAYRLALSGPPEVFRVYVGAYAGREDAQVMGQILQGVGEPVALIFRIGRR